ncbi:MAG TPA: Wzz/FepE/Etk N-terminal domain-containing protein [Anaerolineae bacterium]|nr:Wzz/FepE/Etk N-terminal domain-containing protein [Anaerolineae bacterium]
MELQLYLDILKRRLFVILIVIAVVFLIVTTAGFLLPPRYTARATVRVLLDVGVQDFNTREDYSKRLLNTYSYVLRSSPTLKEAVRRLPSHDILVSIAELRENVVVEVVPDTELISIAVEDGNPFLARDLANMLALLLMEYAQNIYVGSSKSSLMIIEEQMISVDQQIQADRRQLSIALSEAEPTVDIEALESKIAFAEDSYDRLLDRYETTRLNESLRANSVALISPASLPTEPSNSLGLMEIGIGLAVGASGGIAVALILENLDTRIHSAQQLEYMTNTPVLGVLPVGLLSMDAMDDGLEDTTQQAISEAYRLLAVNLPAVKGITASQTILITSAVVGEGKSTVAINLAHTMTERGQYVFLVEVDLRRPTLLQKFKLGKSDYVHPGLSDVLSERVPLSPEAITQVSVPTLLPRLSVIGSGSKVTDPTALLASSEMEELLGYLVTQGYTLVLDAPPVLSLADVLVLAPKVDGVVLVVRQGYSKREQVLATLRQLQASHTNVFGFVFMQKGGKGFIYE